MAFFIIYNPEGQSPPVRQHKTHKEAMAIAHHMAKQHPGQTFFVMKSASRPVCAGPTVLEPTGGDDVTSSAGRAVPDKDNSENGRAQQTAEPQAMARSEQKEDRQTITEEPMP